MSNLSIAYDYCCDFFLATNEKNEDVIILSQQIGGVRMPNLIF